MEYMFDIPEANALITSGGGGAGRAIGRWFRQGRITGAIQREKNAKIWLNANGVREAWSLWARHRGLDPEADMPSALRTTVAGRAQVTDPMLSLLTPSDITVIVPPGTTVRVVQAVV